MKTSVFKEAGTEFSKVVTKPVARKLSLIEINSCPDGTRIDYKENGENKRAYGQQAKRIYRDIYIEEFGGWDNIPSDKRLEINMLMLFGRN